ncbi:MAG: cyclic nucleotide-binding domain-containing protein [Spirochaetales bacterium]|nr:cyclic nucleotide-binding domain-containing protein [Spirochaetales bacterium]
MPQFFPWLREIYFFKALKDSEINEIESICHERECPEGAVVFRENDKPDNFYIVVEGAVEVWKNYYSQPADLLAVHGPGNFFGEMALIDDLPRSATVIAKEVTRLLYIAKQDFEAIIRKSVSVAYSIMISISQIIRNSNESYVANLNKRNIELENANKELRTAQKELIKAERLSTVGKFSSMIIHDLKNPISIIKSYAEMIPMNSEDREKTLRSASNIVKEAERLARLAGELLDFSRGELRLNYSVVSVENLMNILINHISPRTEKNNIKVSCSFPFSGAIVLDFERFQRVLINVCENACKAMGKDGKLELSVYEKNNEIHFVIADNGEGMSEEEVKRIFEPFYSSAKEGGTGLGMLVVQNIVEAHQGRLEISSKKGKGTTVEIILPRKQKL